MKELKPPMLSTAFSQNGKKAKNRIDNILGGSKKMSINALIAVVLVTAAAGTMVACSDTAAIGGADGPAAMYITDSSDAKDAADKLYAAKIKYIGGASGVGNIMQLLGQDKIGTWSGMELETSEKPFGVIRNYKSPIPSDKSELKKQAAIMLCLIENADFVRYVFTDGEAEYTREELSSEMGNLEEYAKSKKSFREFYSTLYDETNTDNMISAAILEQSKDGYLSGECRAEGHIILGTEKIAKTGSSNTEGIAVYALVSYGEYGFENGNFEKISGSGVIPTKITFDMTGKVINYEMPSDGSEYQSSLKKLFPKEYWSVVSGDLNSYYKDCIQQEHAYAERYLNSIGRKAQIGEYADFDKTLLTHMGVPTEVSNNLLNDKRLLDYPMWIGNREQIENNTRYVYTTFLEKDEIIYNKRNYETLETVETYTFDAKTGKQIK